MESYNENDEAKTKLTFDFDLIESSSEADCEQPFAPVQRKKNGKATVFRVFRYFRKSTAKTFVNYF